MTAFRALNLKASGVGVALVVVTLGVLCDIVIGSPTNSIDKPEVFNLLSKVIKDRDLSKAESLKSDINAKPILEKRTVDKRIKATQAPSFKSDLLRQELTKETEDNCLAKLLCGTPLKQNTSNYVSDYAVLVKEFFDFFADDPAEEAREEEEKKKKDAAKKKKKDKEEDDGDDDDENDDKNNDPARTGENIVNITGSIIDDEDEVTTSTIASVSSVTTGATITDIPSASMGPIDYAPNTVLNTIQRGSFPHRVTLEELVGGLNLSPKDFISLRQARNMNMKSKTVTMGEMRQSAFINRKLREMKMAPNDAKKLQIAGQIATTIRQPRQCKEFHTIASQILSTCPLTSEVVRYFNSNLQKDTQIALVRQSANNTDGGLVVLNDNRGKPHAYFLDNSPVVANTNINTDLKNPSVNDRFPIDELRHPVYENAFPQKFNFNTVSLANKPPSKKKPEKKDEDDDDENSDENEDDDEDDNDEEEDDGEGDGDEEDDQEQENEVEPEQDDNNDVGSPENDDEEFVPNRRDEINANIMNRERSSGTTRRVPSSKLGKYKRTRPQRKKAPQNENLPPGIIKVYGVPQPSFDNEFSRISNQIGSGPVIILDQDDYDSHIPPPPGTPQKTPASSSSRPVRRPRPPLQQYHQQQQQNTDYRRRQQKTTSPPPSSPKPKIKTYVIQSRKSTVKPSFSAEDEDDDDNDDENGNNGSVESEVFNNDEPPPPQPPTTAYFNNYNGNFPAPRPEEYYQNGRPLRPPPPTPYKMQLSYRPDVTVRGRLNFMHSPGASLMRPYGNINPNNNPNPNNYRFYGKK